MTSLFAIISALLGTPLFAIIGALALYSFFLADTDLTVVFIEMYRIAETPTLTAIPLFALTGFTLAASKAPARLVSFSQALLGWLPGGLAIMAILVCAVFTALTGASGMTIVALGGLLLPALQHQRMPDSFSLGLITTSGSLGLLFPPSLPLIIYAIVSETPVDQLFIAGLAPGILLISALSVYSYLQGERVAPIERQHSFKQLPKAFADCSWELLLPFVILGGIYGGFIAISEAAALSAMYVLIVEVLIRKEIPVGKMPEIIRDSMVLFGGIIVVMATAIAYTSYMIDAEIPTKLLDYIQTHVDNRWLFLILLNVFLLAVGCMIDMFSALILVVPLILPIAQAYDVHPVHLGIIFLTNLEIGYSTPPVGLNLFISSIRFERPIIDLYRASIPFLIILLFCLALITYFPAISLFLIDT